MAAPSAPSRCLSMRAPIVRRWSATSLCCLPNRRSAGLGPIGSEAQRATRIRPQVVAFAGIARPGKLYGTLGRVGAQIVAARDFPDHHAYTQREVEALIREAGRRGALLGTT